MLNFLKSYRHYFFWMIFTVVSGYNIYKAYSVAETSIMPDLRIKATGARLMGDGQLPYFYKWQKNDREIYCNPYDRPGKRINGLSVPPSVLWLMQPTTRWNYCSIMKFWFWSQETFLCAAGLIVTILLSSFTSRVFASVIFFYFNGSEAWFYHIEQGQMYALYAFAFALLYLIVKKCRHKQEWSGIWEAFFAWLRPLFGIIVLANLYKKDKKGLIAFSVVGVALIIMTSIADQWKHWEEYRAAIKEYTLEVNGRLSPDTSHQIAIPPAILENCVTSKAPTLVNDAGALYSLQHYFKRLGLEINNSGFFIAITLIASLIGLYTFYRRIGAVSIEQEVVFLFLVYLFSELISPAVRNPYNLVQWCVPSMLIAAGFRNNKLAAYLLFAGFILNSQLIHLLPKYQREIGELLLIAASLIFIYRRDSLTAVRK